MPGSAHPETGDHDDFEPTTPDLAGVQNAKLEAQGKTVACRSRHDRGNGFHTNAFPSNWELSAGRAASVARALIESGVSPGQLTIQGQSQFKPLVSNSNDTDRRTNRRVEISLITG